MFVWANDIVVPIVDSDIALALLAPVSISNRLVWISEHMWRVLGYQFESLIGYLISTSEWRHVAIVIANRHLHGIVSDTIAKWFSHIQTKDDMDSEEDRNDNMYDLQANYSFCTTGAIYICEQLMP